jgi:hypothetical protein
MFWTVPLSIIRSFSLYTQQWYLSYRLVNGFRAGSGWNILILLATIAVCTVKTPDDGQMNCLKHVEFHSKNKFEKLVHLVGFIIRNLSRCRVTWTSKTQPCLMNGTLQCYVFRFPVIISGISYGTFKTHQLHYNWLASHKFSRINITGFSLFCSKCSIFSFQFFFFFLIVPG